MSAEGYEIKVGVRYLQEDGEGYYAVPSHVTDTEVLFTKYRPDGDRWAHGRMELMHFRFCYAPCATDLLAEAQKERDEAVELLDMARHYMKPNTDDYTAVKAFISRLGKGEKDNG